jgi:hypothetical protein
MKIASVSLVFAASILLAFVPAARLSARQGAASSLEPQQSPPSPATPSPALPGHMLVVFPPGAARPGNAALVRGFARLLSQGWLVSVTRPDGTFTGYCDRASLKDALEAKTGIRGTSMQANIDIVRAVDALAGLPGPKALLAETFPAHDKTAPAWVDALVHAKVPVYLVDGGRFDDAYYDDSWGYSRGPSPAGSDFVSKRKRYYEDGIFHEVRLSKAVKDMLSDSHKDFNPPS